MTEKNKLVRYVTKEDEIRIRLKKDRMLADCGQNNGGKRS